MKKKRFIIIFCFIIICFGLFIGYQSIVYNANDCALDYLKSCEKVEVLETDDYISFITKDAKNGFIFYPGGFVDDEAYAPLLHRLADENIACILCKMPLHLAVLDINHANDIQTLYPNIENWYIGGHSLGGSMAAEYLSNHLNEYQGLILLAAYSTADLSTYSHQVLSIYGSEDQVLNHQKYQDNYINLPSNTIEYIIDGGNHAFFGDYGEQKGDGIAIINHIQQHEITTSKIIDFIQP